MIQLTASLQEIFGHQEREVVIHDAGISSDNEEGLPQWTDPTFEALASSGDSQTQELRSLRILSELDELSQSQVSRTGRIDYSDLPDLEEVDQREIAREKMIWDHVIKQKEHDAEKKPIDQELEGLD